MLTEKEKTDLKLRIDNSIQDYRNKKKRTKRWYLSGAAALLVIFIVSSYYLNSLGTVTDIEKFVNTNDIDIKKDENVVLVLSDNKEISINDKNSAISYSDSGEELHINNSKIVKQPSNLNSYNTAVVPFGKRSKIILSDGTQVWINSGSKLTYPINFDNENREVHLIGEAIFDVTHNPKKPFYVITKDYKVKVLGTVFNVSSYNDDKYTSTALESGKVQIDYKGKSFFKKSNITILPGTLAVYNRGTNIISTKKVDIEKHLSWKEGKFIFNKEPLDIIAKKLSRYYDTLIAIENDALKKETFSGHLDLKDNIVEVIDVIKQTSNLNYKKENNKIVIY